MTDKVEVLHNYGDIRAEIIALLYAARTASVRSINSLMTATYWEIGRRIVEFEQEGQERAEYGEALIRQLAVDLTGQFGRGFGAVNLSQMRRFYLEWPLQRIFQTPSEKSSALSELAASFRCRGLLTFGCFRSRIQMRAPSMKPRPFVPAGRFDSLIVRLAASFTSALLSQSIKLQCWRVPNTPSRAMP